MKIKIHEEIEIPEGVHVTIEGNKIIVKGKHGENVREFKIAGIVLEKKEDKVILRCDKATKKEKRIIKTTKAHIVNMLRGVGEKFEYKLKVCFSHFPVNVEVKGKEVIIKNFLGEKIPRKAKLPEGVDIKVEKDVITIKSSNKELAGQTAADLEKATRISLRDRRIFQDGIFITSKNGREM